MRNTIKRQASTLGSDPPHIQEKKKTLSLNLFKVVEAMGLEIIASRSP
jgi:hypothetical protein